MLVGSKTTPKMCQTLAHLASRGQGCFDPDKVDTAQCKTQHKMFCILYFALGILHQGLTLTLQCKIGFGMRGWSGTLPNDAKNLLLVGLKMTQNVPNFGTYMASMGQGFSDPQCHMFNTLADFALGGWGFVRHHIRY